MGAMDPRTALETCENALRELMQYAYSREYGSDWLRTISNSGQRRMWASRAESEPKVRPGVAALPPEGLTYSDFSDLITIARNFWPPLEPALGPKNETLPLLERFEQLRNGVAHSRGILIFEEDLLSGIAGQVRNQVTIFMSTQDPSGDYYPRIELVRDRFGNQIEPVPGERNQHVSDGLCRAKQVLRVGDTVDFECVGTDPKDRELHWKLRSAGAPEHIEVAPSGAPVRLRWTAGTSGESCEVQIHLNSPSPYHRRSDNDGLVLFVYKVLPPE